MSERFLYFYFIGNMFKIKIYFLENVMRRLKIIFRTKQMMQEQVVRISIKISLFDLLDMLSRIILI